MASGTEHGLLVDRAQLTVGRVVERALRVAKVAGELSVAIDHCSRERVLMIDRNLRTLLKQLASVVPEEYR